MHRCNNEKKLKQPMFCRSFQKLVISNNEKKLKLINVAVSDDMFDL